MVAADEAEARRLLDAALVGRGLDPNKNGGYSLREVDTSRPGAKILLDGDY